ncbi:MAG: 3-isopropylmalate dehydrogenase [Syntrophobacter sp. DG_60]|nr:MAG: 3-isopropylmalate dehydrogenase [Syntrophobacter sp. DG_60]
MRRHYKIGVISGDGIGPEVAAEGIKVLEAASEVFDIKFDFIYYPYGGEHYLRTKELLPDGAIEAFKDLDAIYFGAIGHPDVKPGILEQGILLKIRQALDQYINLRPVRLYPGVYCPIKDKGPEDIGFVVVRENTEGLYVGTGGFLKHGTKEEVAIQTSINTYKGIERCIRYAFEYCQKRNKMKKVTLCGKSNVLTYASGLWVRVFEEIANDYPDIKTDYAHVDAICMWMIKNPEKFDIIVTDNMFGDIITDLGAILQGGLGIAAGGNINPKGVSMFEPIGGSAPKYRGKGIANPLAAISAAQIMLETLSEDKAAQAIEEGVIYAASHLKGMSAGEMGYITSEVGSLVAQHIERSL